MLRLFIMQRTKDSNLWRRKWQDLLGILFLWRYTWMCRSSSRDSTAVCTDGHWWTDWRLTSRTLWTMDHRFLPIWIKLSSSSSQDARRFCQLGLYRYWPAHWGCCLRCSDIIVIVHWWKSLQCTKWLVTKLKICSNRKTAITHAHSHYTHYWAIYTSQYCVQSLWIEYIRSDHNHFIFHILLLLTL